MFASARRRAASLRRLPRRVIRRLRREVAGLRWITVRPEGRDAVRVSRVRGVGRRSYRLDDLTARYVLGTGKLRLVVPDAAALVRIAVSGVLTGEIQRLEIRLADAPEWLLAGVRPPRLGRTAVRFHWRRRGRGLTLQLGWSKPYGLNRAFADALAAVVRARRWDQVSGPLYALDRTAWLAGAACWPQGQLAAGPPRMERDAFGRPLGPFLAPDQPTDSHLPPLVTMVANSYGRRLVGAATPYRLAVEPDRLELRDEAGRTALVLDRATAPEAVVARAELAKYAVVSVDPPLATNPFVVDPFTADALRALAACGMVFATTDPAVRGELDTLGLVSVRHAKEVDDLRGYALSVAASRRMAVSGDAVLRRTPLGGAGMLPLPTVSVVLSSMRSDYVEGCLRHLAGQTYPALELLVGLHGYDVPEQTRERWRAMLGFPVRVVPFSAQLTFGAVLGRLSRMADGELLTKMDDDDHYGPHHLADLVIAWHTSGADVAAKGSRFVYFPELDQTIDRAWAAPEIFNVTPAGGTLLLARSTLQQLGGWSHSSKHVDTDLLIRVKSAGGLVYRTHALEYVYVRRTTGHTWITEIEELIDQGEHVYDGLPEEIIRPDYTSHG
jgi:hypothetical protein